MTCPADGTPLAGRRSEGLAPGGLAPGGVAPGGLAPGGAVVLEVKTAQLAPGTPVGEYLVEGKIGEGGMGAVYAARHPVIGKRAAIKVISPALCTDPAAVERFVQEARAANQIGHPNIVDVFAFGTLPDGRSYLVMEHLAGESLAGRLARGRLSFAEALEILDQTSDALEAAHEAGIIHRDLKPDNVFLVAHRGGRQQVKLLDFGIAKLAAGDTRVQRTATGVIMGTPGYISPEQARGRHVDSRTDIYALGALAYEVLLGRLPFVADNAMDIVLAHMTEPPPPPSRFWPEIPPRLAGLLTGMLEKDRERRPSLGELRACIDELRAGAPGHGAVRSVLTPPHMRAVSLPGDRPHVGPRALEPTAAPGDATMVTPVPPVLLSDLRAASPRRRGGILVGAGLGIAVLGGAVLALTLAAGGDGERAGGAPIAGAGAGGTAAPLDAAPAGPRAPASDAAGASTTVADAAPAAPREAPGILVVRANVKAARIEVDGALVATETAEAGVAVEPARAHAVVITAPGRKRWERTVTVAAGATLPVEARLQRAGGGSGPAGGSKDCVLDMEGRCR